MKRPRLVLLADYPNWAFDYAARSIVRRFGREFDCSVAYGRLAPRLDPARIDLLHVFFWGEQSYRPFGFKPEQIVKEVASVRWRYEPEYGYKTPEEFARLYLDDSATIVTPSESICRLVAPARPDIFHVREGVEVDLFRPPTKERMGRQLTIGWVGNPGDRYKGLEQILRPAAAGYRFRIAGGTMTRRKLSKFYKEIDVLAIASLAEGQPQPLLESMASGCFPVCTNVGIVPELIEHGVNGLIAERDVDAFKAAFAWCERNRDRLRQAAQRNRELAASRAWDHCAPRLAEIYRYALNKQNGVDASPPGQFVTPSSKGDAGQQAPPQQPRHIGTRTSARSLVIEDAIVRSLFGHRFKTARPARLLLKIRHLLTTLRAAFSSSHY